MYLIGEQSPTHPENTVAGHQHVTVDKRGLLLYRLNTELPTRILSCQIVLKDYTSRQELMPVVLDELRA